LTGFLASVHRQGMRDVLVAAAAVFTIAGWNAKLAHRSWQDYSASWATFRRAAVLRRRHTVRAVVVCGLAVLVVLALLRG
jgi:hypothetical protein